MHSYVPSCCYHSYSMEGKVFVPSPHSTTFILGRKGSPRSLRVTYLPATVVFWSFYYLFCCPSVLSFIPYTSMLHICWLPAGFTILSHTHTFFIPHIPSSTVFWCVLLPVQCDCYTLFWPIPVVGRCVACWSPACLPCCPTVPPGEIYLYLDTLPAHLPLLLITLHTFGEGYTFYSCWRKKEEEGRRSVSLFLPFLFNLPASPTYLPAWRWLMPAA